MVQESAPWARELWASCKEGSPEPGGQQGRQSPQSSRAEPLAVNVKGDQQGMEQPSGVWSSAIWTVVWSLPQLYLESGAINPSGSFDKCLGTPDGEWGISPGAYLWMASLWRHGFLTMCASRCVSLPGVSALIMCTGNLAVSPYQMCLAGSSLKRETT